MTGKQLWEALRKIDPSARVVGECPDLWTLTMTNASKIIVRTTGPTPEAAIAVALGETYEPDAPHPDTLRLDAAEELLRKRGLWASYYPATDDSGDVYSRCELRDGADLRLPERGSGPNIRAALDELRKGEQTCQD